jgi:hypothetical protein
VFNWGIFTLEVDESHVVRAGKKKPVVLASNLGRHPSNPLKLARWCLRSELNRDPLFGKQRPVNAVHFFSANFSAN